MNTQTSQRVTSPTRAKLFRTLHRYLGLALFLPVLLLAITGVLLEFTTQLALGQTGVPFTSVHRQYNIKPPGNALQSGSVFQLGERLFTPTRQFSAKTPLRGAHTFDQFNLVFLEHELIIVPLIDDAPEERTPLPNYARVGFEDDLTWVLEYQGVHQISHDLGVTWQVGDGSQVNWLSVTSSTPNPVQIQRYGEAHISWERWLQDLHSGRYFGTLGSWIMSLAGLAFIMLAITGLFVWASRLKSPT